MLVGVRADGEASFSAGPTEVAMLAATGCSLAAPMRYGDRAGQRRASGSRFAVHLTGGNDGPPRDLS